MSRADSNLFNASIRGVGVRLWGPTQEIKPSQPGRFGAENSNYGLVQLDGTPWALVTKRMTEENGAVESLHAK